MRLVVLLASLAGLAMGQPRYSWPFSTVDASTVTTSLNGAISGGYSSSWLDFGFVPRHSKTLSKVRFGVSSVTGTLASNDICISLSADATNGDPGTVLETRCTVTATPTGAALVEVTGFTTALTQNTPYHLVVLNADVAPTTNFFAVTSVQMGDGAAGATGSNVAFGYQYQTSTNSGGSWTAIARIPGWVLEYSDGTREGFPFRDASTSAIQIYGTRKAGLEITIPPGPNIAFDGIMASIQKTLSPSGVAFSVVKGTGNSRTTICTGGSITGGAIATTRHVAISWCTQGTVIVAPGDTIAIIAESTNTADTSGNRTNLTQVRLWSQDADMEGPTLNMATVLSTDGGSTWTRTAHEFAGFSLLLSSGRPLRSISGGFAITQ